MEMILDRTLQLQKGMLGVVCMKNGCYSLRPYQKSILKKLPCVLYTTLTIKCKFAILFCRYITHALVCICAYTEKDICQL